MGTSEAHAANVHISERRQSWMPEQQGAFRCFLLLLRDRLHYDMSLRGN